MRVSTSRPNIIYIVSDDLGYADLGCYGGRDAQFGGVSPNIDKLAAGGMKFTRDIPIRLCVHPPALP